MGTGPVGEIRTHSRRHLRPLRLPIAARPEILVGEEGFEPSLFALRATGFTDRRNTAIVAALPCAERESNPQKGVFEAPVSASCTIGANKKGHLLGVAFSSNYFLELRYTPPPICRLR